MTRQSAPLYDAVVIDPHHHAFAETREACGSERAPRWKRRALGDKDSQIRQLRRKPLSGGGSWRGGGCGGGGRRIMREVSTFPSIVN